MVKVTVVLYRFDQSRHLDDELVLARVPQVGEIISHDTCRYMVKEVVFYTDGEVKVSGYTY